jgi:hypothetical protein
VPVLVGYKLEMVLSENAEATIGYSKVQAQSNLRWILGYLSGRAIASFMYWAEMTVA